MLLPILSRERIAFRLTVLPSAAVSIGISLLSSARRTMSTSTSCHSIMILAMKFHRNSGTNIILSPDRWDRYCSLSSARQAESSVTSLAESSASRWLKMPCPSFQPSDSCPVHPWRRIFESVVPLQRDQFAFCVKHSESWLLACMNIGDGNDNAAFTDIVYANNRVPIYRLRQTGTCHENSHDECDTRIE